MTQDDPTTSALRRKETTQDPSDRGFWTSAWGWMVSPRGVSTIALVLGIIALYFSRQTTPVALPEYTGTPAVDSVIAQAAVTQRQNSDLLQVVLWSLGTIGVVAAGLIGISAYQNRWASERDRRAVLAEARGHTDDVSTQLRTTVGAAIQGVDEKASRANVEARELITQLRQDVLQLQVTNIRYIGRQRITGYQILYEIGDALLFAQSGRQDDRDDNRPTVARGLEWLIAGNVTDLHDDDLVRDLLHAQLDRIGKVYEGEFRDEISKLRLRHPRRHQPVTDMETGRQDTRSVTDTPSV